MDKKAGKDESFPKYSPPRVIKIGNMKNGEGYGIESACSPSGATNDDQCVNTGTGAGGCNTGAINTIQCSTGSNPTGGKTGGSGPVNYGSLSYGDVAVDEFGDAV